MPKEEQTKEPEQKSSPLNEELDGMKSALEKRKESLALKDLLNKVNALEIEFVDLKLL